MLLLCEIVFVKTSAILSGRLQIRLMPVSLKAAGLILPSFPRKTELTGIGSFRILSSRGECFPADWLTLENKSMVVPFICLCHNLVRLLDIAFTKFVRIPQKDNNISPQDNPWAGMSMAAKKPGAA
jgi:hypothetical protein